MITLCSLLLCVTSASAALLHTTLHDSGLLELRLARQDKLNALSPALLSELELGVGQALADDRVTGLLLSAEPGRAFCAGGDVREVAALKQWEADDFLRREYELMLRLLGLQQEMPVVALADGIVFGAGAGLFMSAGTRIASSATTFAMPELALGIIPDVGATDFLSTLPGSLGLWMSFTGARIEAPRMAGLGLSTHACETGDVEDLRQRLLAVPAGPGTSWERRRYCRSRLEAVLVPEEEAARSVKASQQPELQRLADASSRVFGSGRAAGGARYLQQLDEKLVEEVVEARAAGAPGHDAIVAKWATEARAALRRGCPAAMLFAFEAMRANLPTDPYHRRARALGIELAANQALALRQDFQEGVACAVGARRGEAPRWKHASIAEADADPSLDGLLVETRHAKAIFIEPFVAAAAV